MLIVSLTTAVTAVNNLTAKNFIILLIIIVYVVIIIITIVSEREGLGETFPHYCFISPKAFTAVKIKIPFMTF